VRGIIRVPRSLLALVAAITLASAVGGAQEVTARFPPEVEREASLLFRDVMSPFCPGMTLSTCPSPGAELMRDSLRGALAAGQTRREVLDDIHRQFIDVVREGRGERLGSDPDLFSGLVWTGARRDRKSVV
jgi:cytochrome c-type biogenesis protein CcmH/NrfF